MVIKETRRPWIKNTSFGKKYNPDSFYQSSEWKQTRTAFLMSRPWQVLPQINGKNYENKFCVECWKQGKITNTHTVDHIQRKRNEGNWTDFSNLQGLCLRHHNSKSASEKNEKYKK